MRKVLYISCVLLLALTFFSLRSAKHEWTKDTPISTVLNELVGFQAGHTVKYDQEQVNIGRELVLNGHSTRKSGKKSTYISAYFVCTDCHNLEREDPVLTDLNPDARLTYAKEKGIPFMPATTFWGIVNREAYYNDDYYKKYGDLVDKARSSLRESTQLCAKECSSGRYLKEWELEAIIQYYWTLQLKLGDLDITDEEMTLLNAVSENESKRNEAADWLRSKYLLASSAHVLDVPKDKKKGYTLSAKPNIENGKQIYDSSCKNCHRAKGPSQLVLDDSKFTFRKLLKDIDRHDPTSIYEAIRHGTYAEPGHQQYMPFYTKERISNEQIEDLRAYIEVMAGKGL